MDGTSKIRVPQPGRTCARPGPTAAGPDQSAGTTDAVRFARASAAVGFKSTARAGPLGMRPGEPSSRRGIQARRRETGPSKACRCQTFDRGARGRSSPNRDGRSRGRRRTLSSSAHQAPVSSFWPAADGLRPANRRHWSPTLGAAARLGVIERRAGVRGCQWLPRRWPAEQGQPWRKPYRRPAHAVRAPCRLDRTSLRPGWP